MAESDLHNPQAFRIDRSGRSVAYFCRSESVGVTVDLLEALKTESIRLGQKNLRLCLHQRPEDSFHDMVILTSRGCCQPPHVHEHKAESWHLIEGVMDIFVFSGAGKVIDAARLEAGRCMIHRVGAGLYHATVPVSDRVIFHEARPGPYRQDEAVATASWAPDSQDEQALARFYQDMQETMI